MYCGNKIIVGEFLLERKHIKIIQQSTYTDRKVKRQLYQSILLTIMSNTEEKTHSDLVGISHIILCIQPPHRQLRLENTKLPEYYLG